MIMTSGTGRARGSINASGFGLSALGSVLADGPWWATSLLVSAALACALVETLFPQESADRLEWWRDRRRVREHSRRGGVAASHPRSSINLVKFDQQGSNDSDHLIFYREDGTDGKRPNKP